MLILNVHCVGIADSRSWKFLTNRFERFLEKFILRETGLTGLRDSLPSRTDHSDTKQISAREKG
jgi:hypothetical protein